MKSPIKTTNQISLQAVIDGLEDELIVIDKNFRIIQANRAFYTRHNYQHADVIGKYCYDVSHGLPELCKPPRHECPINNVWETGKSARATHMHLYQLEGLEQKRYVDVIAAPIFDEKSKVIYIVELLRDVTEAKQLELEIHEAHQNLIALNKIANIVSQSLDLDTVLRSAVNMTLELLKADIGGIMLLDEATQLYRYRVQHGLSDKYVSCMNCRIGEGIAGTVMKTGKSIVLNDISRDKRAIHLELIKAEGLKGFASIPLVLKSKVLGVLNIASKDDRHFSAQEIALLSHIGVQVTVAIENARLHYEVQRQDTIRGELLNQLYRVQEEERKRIARELHDQTTQSLAALAANLEAISLTPSIKNKALKSKLKTLQNIAIKIIDETHRLIYELRPTMLDDLGLLSAVRSYAKQEFTNSKIVFSLTINGKEKRLPPSLESTLYRVIQETINNITRHANATRCDITLNFNSRSVTAVIMDNGQGFDVRKMLALRDTPKGLGLLGMRERIELVHGSIEINSTPNGKGTSVKIKIPVGNGGNDG